MDLVRKALSELLALFVDDGSLALAVIAWVAGGVISLRSGWVDPGFEAFLLFLGIAVLLAENVGRTARTHRSGRAG